MKNILVIFKKELKRFFTDRRMLIAMFLPGILIYVVYSIMGSFFKDNLFNEDSNNVTYKIAYTDNYSADTTNKPKLLSILDTYLDQQNLNNKAECEKISTLKVEDYKVKLSNNEVDLIIEYSANFEDTINTVGALNNVNLYYNGEKEDSEKLYSLINSLIPTSYNNYTQNLDISTSSYIDSNVGESSATLGKIIGFMLPMLTVSLLYSAVLSFCPESISGEKERGTLASILLTPIKRSEFVIGKIIALSIVAVISGAASFAGLVSSLPTLMGMETLPFSFGQMSLLLLIMVSTLLMFVGLGVLVSSLSNSVKEASSLLAPFMFLFMILSFVPMVVDVSGIGFAFVPIVNLSACISNLLSPTGNITLFFTFTVLANLAFTGLFVYLVTRIFNREKTILGQ